MSSVKGLSFSIAFLLSTLIYSQNKKIDSLRTLSENQDNKNKIITYLDIATIYTGINLDSSKIYTKKAYELSKAEKNDSLSIKSLASLGFRHFESGNYENAINFFNEALKISEKIKDSTSIADITNGFAIVYSKKGDLKKSIEYNFKTLNIYEQINDSLGIGNSLMNIGWDYRKLKEFDKSLVYNLKSLKVYEDLDNTLRVAMVNNNIAGTQNELGNYEKAIDYSKKSKEYFTKLGYKRFTAYPISVMAVAFDSLQKPIIAQKNYKEAIELHTQNREPFELAFLNYSLANLYYKQKKYNEAQSTAEKAIAFAEEVESKEYIADISKLLSKIYEKQRNYILSNKYLKQYVIFNDSIINNEKLKSIAEIETKYETEKKEKEIAVQKEQLLEQELSLKNRNLYAIIITAILLILGIIFYAVYKRNQLRRDQLKKEIDLKDALATITTQNRLQEQRLRISRDLHDNIGSQLTFIISSIDNLKYVSKNTSDKLKEKLTEISSFTGDTIHQLRDTIWAMNKNKITIEDLNVRVLSFTQKAKTAFLDVQFKIMSNVVSSKDFSSLAGINIFRVIQEAINNSLKYADAEIITINFEDENGVFKAQIQDDGKGFSLDNITLGNGLSNMEKRMSEIGGSIKINSSLNEGTKVEIEMPFKNTTNDV